MRGFRGATTISQNTEQDIMDETRQLVLEMVQQNNIEPTNISHVFFTVTDDINAAFPAKVARELPGWSHVPVMCMREIDVPNSLEKCIRVMLLAETDLAQKEVIHIFLNDAVKLRPDLINEEGE